LASKILNGESADEIPLIDEMTEDQYEYRLDYNKLKKFEISLSKLEELKKQNYKIKVINEPLSFFKKYQKELTITSVSFRKTGGGACKRANFNCSFSPLFFHVSNHTK
jgi:hypothetical protein